MTLVDSDELRRETSKNPTLSKALQLTMNGEWSTHRKHNSDLDPDYQRTDELSAQQ